MGHWRGLGAPARIQRHNGGYLRPSARPQGSFSLITLRLNGPGFCFASPGLSASP